MKRLLLLSALLAAFVLAEPTESHYRAHSYSRALRSSLSSDVVPLLCFVPILHFAAMGLQTFGYQLTRSAGLAALMMPLEIPIATFLQVATHIGSEPSTTTVPACLC